VVLTDYSFGALARFGEGPRIQLDAQRLPFRDESIDAFFSVATLEHVPRPEAVLEEIDRCLAPGGRALLFPAWHVGARRGYVARGLSLLPRRALRELQLALGRRLPFDYRRLQPNLEEYVASDSDAFARMDPHACALFYLSRGYRVRGADSLIGRLALRYVPVEVQRPARVAP
jgi:SAM-dependent methyltransferase